MVVTHTRACPDPASGQTLVLLSHLVAATAGGESYRANAPLFSASNSSRLVAWSSVHQLNWIVSMSCGCTLTLARMSLAASGASVLK